MVVFNFEDDVEKLVNSEKFQNECEQGLNTFIWDPDSFSKK